MNSTEQSGIDPSLQGCPPNYLGLSIFSAIMFPTGIAAIVKASLVELRWRQGRYDDARYLSSSALAFAKGAIIAGAILITISLIYMTVYTGILIALLTEL